MHCGFFEQVHFLSLGGGRRQREFKDSSAAIPVPLIRLQLLDCWMSCDSRKCLRPEIKDRQWAESRQGDLRSLRRDAVVQRHASILFVVSWGRAVCLPAWAPPTCRWPSIGWVGQVVFFVTNHCQAQTTIFHTVDFCIYLF